MAVRAGAVPARGTVVMSGIGLREFAYGAPPLGHAIALEAHVLIMHMGTCVISAHILSVVLPLIVARQSQQVPNSSCARILVCPVRVRRLLALPRCCLWLKDPAAYRRPGSYIRRVALRATHALPRA